MNLIGHFINLLQALYIVNVGESMRRVCYLTNWAQHRDTPHLISPESVTAHIDASLCTHIILAFFDIRNGVLHTREQNDIGQLA